MSTAPTARPRATPVADEAALRKVLSSTPRPPRASALSATLTFGWRGMLKVKHVPEQLLDVTITPVMFLLMFTYLFGGAIADSTGEYLDYILPGILVMSVLFTTVYSGVALNTDVTITPVMFVLLFTYIFGGVSREREEDLVEARLAEREVGHLHARP